MRIKILAIAAMFFSLQASAQWVRPNTFPELTTVTDSTFEVYSQRFGLTRKASLSTIKKFMDQSLAIVGDSVCITKTTGTVCVKLPAQAFSMTSQSYARAVVSQSYSVPADTVAKYDYIFVQYETNSTPSGSTITLPSPGASTMGKVIDLYVYLGPSASISSATVSGTLCTVSGTSVAFVGSYSAIPGHYRFVGTDGLQTSGYKWQLVSSPLAPSAAAASSKRTASQTINSANVVFSDTTFRNTDIYTVYAEAETGNTSLKVPIPDSSYAGKMIYYYPAGSTNTNTITCDAVRILKFSSTPFATTTVSSEAVTVAKKLTGVLYEGTYYWEMRDLYNSAAATKSTFSAHKSYSSSDTLKADTVLAYDELHIQVLADVLPVFLTLPAPSASNKGRVLRIYPITSSYVVSIIAPGSKIGRYDSPTSFTTTSSIDIEKNISLVSNGNYWMWYPTVPERIGENKLVGRFSYGYGQAEEISISSDFTMTGGTLALSTTSTSGGYSFLKSTVSTGGEMVITYTGTAPTVTGSAGAYTITVPANARIYSYTFSADTDDLKVDGTLDITVTFTSLPNNINQTEAIAFVPAITIIEKASPWNVQQLAQGAGWQVTHPTISGGSVLSRMTGMQSFGQYIVKANF
jgi:hypothetical protein